MFFITLGILSITTKMHFYKYPINTLDKPTNPLFFFLFLISEENFIQSHEKESPKYTGSIQQVTKTIKCTKTNQSS